MWKNNERGEFVSPDGKAFVFKHGERDWAVYAVGGSAARQGIEVPGGYFKSRKAAVAAYEKENNA